MKIGATVWLWAPQA